MNIATLFSDQIKSFLAEDELDKSLSYLKKLPADLVQCHLKLKDDLLLAGTPFFVGVFQHLGAETNLSHILDHEGCSYRQSDQKQIDFELPFNIALSGERLALNLLQRCSSIATHTRRFTTKAGDTAILDTRKTTPGLRFLEKYAVTVGGGKNHRFSQTDIWMIKDNHKSFFGGVEEAIKFFNEIKGFYQPLVLEIHKPEEIEPAYKLGVRHFMLDNFSPEMIQEICKTKKDDMTFEVSGGITLENIESYAIAGVDAVSSGSLTYDAPNVDISLKFE